MTEQVTNYKCPACGGPVHYDGAAGKLKCDYCDSLYEVDQFESQMHQQNAAAAAAGPNQWMVDSSTDWGADGMKSYTCPSCGAELICDATTAATCCPYCGNQTVVPGQFSGSLKPEFVIPFKTDKEQAKAALKKHYQGKTLLPKSFTTDNHIEEIQGVYVPFWMFDCQTAGQVTFSGTTKQTRRQGNQEMITTNYYDLYRSGSLIFEKVPVDASTRMPDEHMDSIEPYNYNELRPFSMAYMPGFLADKYDVDVDTCGRRMEERCEKTFVDEARKTVKGYENVQEKVRNLAVNKGAVHYAMMPVWLLATKWNGQNFLFAMNGQTGKLVGDLPCDKGKYWGIFAGISVGLIVILQVINSFVLSTPMKGLMMVLVTIILPLVIALITVSVMKGNLKSVAKQKAAAYMSGRLNLSQSNDVYLRSQTETRTVQQK